MNRKADGRPAGKYDAGGHLRVDGQGNHIAYDAGGDAHIYLNGQEVGPLPRPTIRMFNCQCGCGKSYLGLFMGRKPIAFSLEEADGLCNLDRTLPEWLAKYDAKVSTF